MRHLIDFGDLSREEWDTLYQRADQIISAPENFIDAVSYTHLDVYKRQTRNIFRSKAMSLRS